MMHEIKALSWVLLSLPILAKSLLSPDILFNGFSDAGTNISLYGAAETLENGMIQLTDDEVQVVGRALYSYPIQFKSSSNGKVLSFSTAFAFAIVSHYTKLGGHGFAFTVSPFKDPFWALPNQYFGLLNYSGEGNFSNRMLAVEFDTVQDIVSGVTDDNGVGIHVNSSGSIKSAPAVYMDNNSIKHDVNLKSGKIIQAWVDYDSEKNHLTVRISPESLKPVQPTLSLNVDLSSIFSSQMYVGFSSASGVPTRHYILGWNFRINEEATSLSITSLPSLPEHEENTTSLIVGISFLAAFITFLTVRVVFYLFRNTRNSRAAERWELDVGPRKFSYMEIKQATRGFNNEMIIGIGGCGKVFKGVLPNSNLVVAVKRISHESKHGLQEFMAEISSIGRLRHRNLVQLLGWCHRRRNLILVYDFMPNGSLDKYLFKEPKLTLSWEQRFKIIKGVASGLLYLHDEWEQTVIHRDIKAANVLLDAELNGRLGDFGLAKLCKHGSSPSTTKVAGTVGYLAPELTRTGKPTTKSDVFAFGALLLEVVCGRRPINPRAVAEEIALVDLVWEKLKAEQILEVIDPRLNGQFNENEAILALKLGLMCSNNAPDARPDMRHVVRYLGGEAMLPDEIAAPDAYDDQNNYFNSNISCHYFDQENPSCLYTEQGNSVEVEVGTASLLSLSNASDCCT